MMNTNPLLGQVLGGLFGQSMRRRGMGGGLGGAVGGAALGSILAGALGRGRAGGAVTGRTGLGANRTALMMMLLPFAMRWVQRNGGIGAVLKRLQQRGYGNQARSWVSVANNEPIDDRAIQEVVGEQELAQLAQRLGVPQQEVAQAFAEVLPEMVNQLSPTGRLPHEADQVLDDGRAELEQEIDRARQGEPARH